MGIVYGLLTLLAGFMESGPWTIPGLVLIAVMGLPNVVVHELGHAVAARRLLRCPVAVVVGAGPTLFNLRLGAISMQINLRPSRGFAMPIQPSNKNVRLGHLVTVILAGPVASLAYGIVAAVLLGRTAPGSAAHAVLWTMAFLGVYTGLSNLIPFQLEDRLGGRHRSDGALVRRLLHVRATGRLPSSEPVLRDQPLDAAAKRRLVTIVMIGCIAIVLAMVWYVQVAVPR